MRINSMQRFVLAAVGLMLISFPASQGRVYAAQDPQPDAAQPAPMQDPVARLNLTPEQRQRIRAIREQTRGEREAINVRLRESNFALERALDAENPSETEVELRLRDLATAQAESMRMRVLTELRIRRVLTPEQLGMWRSLRRQAAVRRPQQSDNPGAVRRGMEGIRPNQRNGIAPLRRRGPRP